MGKKKKALSDVVPSKSLSTGLFSDTQRILCKVAAIPPESDFVVKTVALGLGSHGSCTTSTDVYRNPLRQVVARTPIAQDLPSEECSTAYFLETLECGHQQAAFFDFHWDEKSHLINDPPKAKRHRCAECGEAQIALKFKPQSVPSPKKKRTA